MERETPNSIDAEMAVLGCIFLSPDSLSDCMDRSVDPDLFYLGKHQLIYESMIQLQDKGEPVSVLTVREKLTTRGVLEQAGGYAYLSSLPDNAPAPGALEYFLGIVHDRYRLRKMLKALHWSAELIYELGGGDVDQCLDSIESQILDANKARASVTVERIREPTLRVTQSLDQYQRGRGLISGIRTGFSYLDKMIGGLHPGEMTILAGRPSTGKTSLASNIIENVAIEQRIPVAIFSMEMRNDDIALRILCTRAKTSFHKVRTGFMSQQDHENIIEASKKVGVAPVYMDDEPALDIMQLRARARRMVQKFDVKLVVVDYLQLATAQKAEGEVQEITKISQGCKMISRQLNIPVLILSQLNREFEKEKKRKPQLSDLRGSGSIEQDADTVLMLYRKQTSDHQEREEQERTNIFPTNIHIAKQRNGPTGDCELIFFKEQMCFKDAYGGQGKQERKIT